MAQAEKYEQSANWSVDIWASSDNLAPRRVLPIIVHVFARSAAIAKPIVKVPSAGTNDVTVFDVPFKR